MCLFIYKMARKLGQPRTICSVSMPLEFHQIAKQYNVNLSEAVRVGIGIILAERGVKDYDSNLNISRRILEREKKIKALVDKLEETTQELNVLKDLSNYKEAYQQEEGSN
jgi:hypothetical protein